MKYSEGFFFFYIYFRHHFVYLKDLESCISAIDDAKRHIITNLMTISYKIDKWKILRKQIYDVGDLGKANNKVEQTMSKHMAWEGYIGCFLEKGRIVIRSTSICLVLWEDFNLIENQSIFGIINWSIIVGWSTFKTRVSGQRRWFFS